MRLRILVCALSLGATIAAYAGCGSASCPIDTRALNRGTVGGFTLDLSLQYIDQDQPRIGTREAAVGELHGPHHDEVRTINRIGMASLSYAPSPRFDLSLTVPFISRDHFHLGSSHEHGRIGTQHNVVPESWDVRGVGDVVLQARTALTTPDPMRRRGLWLLTGVRLPTGATDLRNGEGEAGELPIQPGSGTTDGIAGLSWEASAIRGRNGIYATVPYFVSATYQFRSGDTDGYRLGNELQLSAGLAWPLIARHTDLLFQANARFRARDRIAGEEAAEEAFTGGTFVYATPGIRVAAGGRSAVYGLVQLPIRQDVNAIQITSDRNFIIGVQTSF